VRIYPGGSDPRAEILHGWWVVRNTTNPEDVTYVDDGGFIIEPGWDDDGRVRQPPQ
jgi:hypothetical protein